ncbi:MAG: UDP-N-acetylmuramate dehydrogenase [Armatimonadota bacterium]
MSALPHSLFHDLTDVEVREHEPMSRHTSFAIGGPADLYAIPRSLQGLRHLLVACGQSGLPHTIIGNGSNLLVRDGGLRGVVIQIADNLSAVRRDGCHVIAQSGASLAKLCMFAADEGLSGLSFASGIPGTVGGAVYMNAGAHGGDIGEVVHQVLAYDFQGRETILQHADLDFSYRHSALHDQSLVVAEVTFDLCAGEKVELHSQMCEIVAKRCEKQPVNVPSAGSVFKRPPGDYAGRLIESVGGKGLRVGDAQISTKHAGFIVNLGQATAADVLELIRQIKDRVHAEHGVWLETEIRVIGED